MATLRNAALSALRALEGNPLDVPTEDMIALIQSPDLPLRINSLRLWLEHATARLRMCNDNIWWRRISDAVNAVGDLEWAIDDRMEGVGNGL